MFYVRNTKQCSNFGSRLLHASSTEHGYKNTRFWEDEETVETFLERLKFSLDLETAQDWNSITKAQVEKYGGGPFIRKYSIYELKCIGYPEGKSKYTLPPKPPKYWEDENNVKNFLNEFKEKLNLKTPEDWDKITNREIINFGGSVLLKHYSLYNIKLLGCPEGKHIFSPVYKVVGFWDDKKNVKKFIENLKVKLNLTTNEDWDAITVKHILKFGGRGLLNKFTMNEIKKMGFPDYTCSKKPVGYWDNKDNVLQFLKDLAVKYRLETPEDWNSVSKKQIEDNGGVAILKRYSLYDLKCLACPECKSLFLPKRKWSNEQINQFFDELREKFNLKTPEDWNSISKKQIESIGGHALFRKYSLFEIKCLGCPEGVSIYNSTPKPPGYWDDRQNVIEFLNELKEKLNLLTVEDWKRLSKEQIKAHGGYGLAVNYSLKEIINIQNQFMTEENSNNQKFGTKKSSQRYLFLQVQKLFPGEEIVEDYFHNEISRNSNFPIQFDIFLLNKNIAIEYHGKQHYEDIPSGFSPVELFKDRDEEKIKLCEQYGIKLVIIPYWWDNNLNSLKEFFNKENILN